MSTSEDQSAAAAEDTPGGHAGDERHSRHAPPGRLRTRWSTETNSSLYEQTSQEALGSYAAACTVVCGSRRPSPTQNVLSCLVPECRFLHWLGFAPASRFGSVAAPAKEGTVTRAGTSPLRTHDTSCRHSRFACRLHRHNRLAPRVVRTTPELHPCMAAFSRLPQPQFSATGRTHRVAARIRSVRVRLRLVNDVPHFVD